MGNCRVFNCFDGYRLLILALEGATLHMIVYVAYGLQVRVADRCAEKLEAPFFHVFAYCVGQRRRRRDLAQCFRVVDDRLSVGQEGSEIIAEAAELFLYFQKKLCIAYR